MTDTTKFITDKHAALIRARDELQTQRDELLKRIRRADRELSDVRASARLFDVRLTDEEKSAAANDE